jgi:hypothetical protein
MPVIEEKFDQSRIDGIKRYLQREAEKGRKRDYEIAVDGFKVVSRTDNVEEFEDYEAEIKDNTRNVSITVFDLNSNRNTKYFFHMQSDLSKKSVNGLGEIDQMIQEKLDAKDKEHEMNKLKEKLAETSEALEQAEEYVEQLEKMLEDEKNKKSLATNNLGELLSTAASALIRQNSNKSPALKALGGLLGVEVDNKPIELPSPQIEETEASFERKQETAASGPFDEMTSYRLGLIEDFQSKLDPQQLQALFQIIEYLTDRPGELPVIIDFINKKANSK